MQRPLPFFDSETAYFEVSRTPNRKYIVTLVQGSKRTPVRTFRYLVRCIVFAPFCGLAPHSRGECRMIFLISGRQSKPVINHVYELHQHCIKQSNKTEQKQGDGRADESAPASESREVHHG